MVDQHRLGRVHGGWEPGGLGYGGSGVPDFAALWDVKTGKKVGPLVGVSSSAKVCGFLPDGEHVVVVCHSGDVVINRIRGDVIEKTGAFKAHRELSFGVLAPNAKRLVTVGTELSPEEQTKLAMEAPLELNIPSTSRFGTWRRPGWLRASKGRRCLCHV